MLTLPRIQDYVALGRFASPAGALYLLVPCWWGMLLARDDDWQRTLQLALLFALGAFLMRACGCAWNDLLDRDIDAQSARTQMRPLACGALEPRQALGFMLATALAAACVLAAILVLAEGNLVLYIACAALPFVLLYPMAKRITHYPQLLLGVVFNWGVLCGYSALTDRIELPVLWMWAAGVAWTVHYDTVYAFQDLLDDRKTGVKSLAMRIEGKRAKPILALLYAGFLVLTACALAAAGSSLTEGGAGVLLIGIALAFCYDFMRLDLASPSSCFAFFRREVWRGGIGVSLVLLLASL